MSLYTDSDRCNDCTMEWQAFYNRVYDILVEHAGAHEHYREFYVADVLREERPLTEWRFCGKLGFGGKVWRNDGRVYVTFYREDTTKEREEIRDRVNKLLGELTPPEGVWGPPSRHAAEIEVHST